MCAALIAMKVDIVRHPPRRRRYVNSAPAAVFLAACTCPSMWMPWRVFVQRDARSKRK
jgi:hypothetical protein